MKTTNWQQIFKIFEEAVELDPEARRKFLDQACGNSEDIRQGVEGLLATEKRGDNILDQPIAEFLQKEKNEDVDITAPLPGSGSSSVASPTRIGTYHLLRQIGQGGMSTVYLARRSDDAFKRQMAIKLVRRGMESAAILRRLRIERQILASLDHPNIARLFDGGSTEDGLPYFVMEYVDGVPISTYCQHNQLTIDERLTLFRKVCDAVHYAHQNLVVHRDIKPSNILVTVDGEPKLLDFGIAKLLNPDMASAESEPTATWQRVMTPNYASPEQARGKHITTASDTYSLGVLLYKVLTDRLPRSFKGRSQDEIEQLLTDTDPVPPSAAVVLPTEEAQSPKTPFPEEKNSRQVEPTAGSSQIPATARRFHRLLRGDLDAIVLKALRSVPSQRYGSVEKLAEDIERYQDGLPVVARAGSWRYRAGKFVKRNRSLVAVTAAVTMLLLVFAGTMAWQSTRVARERDKAQLERDEKQAVLDLMLDVFRLSNPYLLPGKKLTVDEALVRSVPVLESRLQDQPDVRSELLHTSGSILSILGFYQPAVVQLEEALALRRELHGDQHSAVVETLGALAAVRTAFGEFEEAEELAQLGVDLARSLPDEPETTLVSALNELVSVRCFRSEYEAAESPALEALALAQKLPRAEEQEISALQYLALIHSQKGAYPESAELNRQALAKLRKLYGERHPLQINILSNLGFVLRRQEEYEAAETAYQDVLDLQQENFGEDFRDPISLSNLAGARLGRADYRGAEEIYGQALAAVLDSLGHDHWRVFAYELAIAQTWIGQGREAETQEKIQTLLQRWRPTLGEDNWRILKAESLLGESISLQGHCQEAEPHLTESYKKLVDSAQLNRRHKKDALERLRNHLKRCGKSPEIARFEAMMANEASGP